MNDWWRKPEPSLKVRIFLQVLRFALAALFFYIAYLGIIWRTTPPASPPVKREGPYRPEKNQPTIKPPAPKPQAPSEPPR
jgi:hypothetical protein